MATEEDTKMPAADAVNEDNSDSDVDMDGMDMDEDNEEEDVQDDDEDIGNDDKVAEDNDKDDGVDKSKELEEDKEIEEARKERMELLAATSKGTNTGKTASKPNDPEQEMVNPQDKFQYILAQSDVFAQFLAGSVAAASGKKGGKKGGSRGKKGRMTEAEEDAQMLKSAQSKRRAITRLDQQPSNLADHCKMHKYQLEGLNWLIKLHDHGINGILADEVQFSNQRSFLLIFFVCGLAVNMKMVILTGFLILPLLLTIHCN